MRAILLAIAFALSFALMFLGIILMIHSEIFWIGFMLSVTGFVYFWSKLPYIE
tara:strand:+ start:7436 stop:7594 length:159 start_codon:yes stop_codon:yes gene_type:complete